MHRNRDIRPHHLHQPHPLRGVHGHHQQGHAGAGDCGAAEVDEEEVDGRVAGGDLVEFGDQEGVAAYVDSVGWVLDGVRRGGGGGGRG